MDSWILDDGFEGFWMYITLAINATLEKQPQGFNFRKCYKSDILKAT